ncbi:MAG: matrixin family metalloprotease [Candidatus Caldarchaeum sp.]|nr:matrixin family metalloprotease [Candidatus Caldarchaeum sp.]
MLKLAAVFLVIFFVSAPTGVISSPYSEFSIENGYGVLQEDGQPSGQPHVELLGAWGKTGLKVYFSPSGSESLDQAARLGVSVWYESIKVFVETHGYNYLLSLNAEYVSDPDQADVTVEYVTSLGERACGVATLRHNSITLEIIRVAIRISRACVGGNTNLAYRVVAHEYGHALGIGHSNDVNDMMYERVNDAEYPSTLNLYALAVAYSWIPDGIFRPPSSRIVSIPPEIPYTQVSTKTRSYVVRVYSESELGKRLLEEYTLPRGTLFRYVAQQENDYGNLTKELFNSWIVGNGRVVYTRNIEFVVSDDVELVARYDLLYFVSVRTFEGGPVGWFRKGSELFVRVQSAVEFGNDTRLVFKGWNDGYDDYTRRIVVQNPISLEAVYVRQYRVFVESPFDVFDGEGWFEEDSWAELSVSSRLVEAEPDVRYRLENISVSDRVLNFSDAIRLKVDGPVLVRAEWKPEFRVIVTASHGKEVLLDSWKPYGSQLVVEAVEEFIWNNGTKAVFSGWWPLAANSSKLQLVVDRPLFITGIYNVYYFLEIVSSHPIKMRSGWVERGSLVPLERDVVLEAGEGRRLRLVGWQNIDEHFLLMTMPKTLIAEWVEEARITVETPKGAYEVWAPLASYLILEAESIIEVDDVRRFVFTGWTSDIENTSDDTLTFFVNGPKYIKQTYREEVKVQLVTLDIERNPVPSKVVVEIDGEAKVIGAGESVWIPLGKHPILSISYNDVDVKPSDHLDVDYPGVYELVLRVYSFRVRVVDFFGLPHAGARVELENSGGRVEGSGRTDMYGHVAFSQVSFAAVRAHVKTPFFSESFVVDPAKRLEEIRIGLSAQAFVILIVLTMSTASFLFAAKHKGKMSLRIIR